jgi:hypothetical protein
MVRNFKFFHGHEDDNFVIYTNNNGVMTVSWDDTVAINTDVGGNLIRMMSEEIARGVDERIIERLTRSVNGGMSA